MGCLNSYAYFIPFGSPLPIVSIKIGYNGREKYQSDKGVHSHAIKAGQRNEPNEHRRLGRPVHG